MTNLLDVRNIHTFIGQFHILEGVSVQVPAGEIVALTFKCDKAADVLGGFFGWTENA